MKKKKLVVIGIAGVAGMLYSATPASAQTFYQCMPVKKCRAGEYLSNNKECKSCPAGYYCINEIKTLCPYGTYALGGAQSCSECESMTYYQGPGGCESNRNKFIQHTLKVGGQVLTNCLNDDSKCGHRITYHNNKYGFNAQFDKYALSCDRYTGKIYYFFNANKPQIQYFNDLFGGGSAAVANCKNNPQTCGYSTTGNNSDGKPSGYVITGKPWY